MTRPKIATPLVTFGMLIAAGAFLGLHLHYWAPSLTGATILWFLLSGSKLFFAIKEVAAEPGFLREHLLETVRIGAFLELFINVRTFALWIELLLLPYLVILAWVRVIGKTTDEYKAVSRLASRLLALSSVALLGLTARSLVVHRSDLDAIEVIRLAVLPIWLTALSLMFTYVMAIYAGYELAFLRMSFANHRERPGLRAKIGVITGFRGRISQLDGFAGQWAGDAARTPSIQSARKQVELFKHQKSRRMADEAADAQRVRDNAGKTGTDEEGRQLDQREFEETRKALQLLATCHMGWYQRVPDGGYYRPNMLEIAGGLGWKGLPSNAGIVMHVSSDGQAWYAYRRTVTGWVLAIGACGPPPNQWLADGPKPPTTFPSPSDQWGDGPFGLNATNW